MTRHSRVLLSNNAFLGGKKNDTYQNNLTLKNHINTSNITNIYNKKQK